VIEGETMITTRRLASVLEGVNLKISDEGSWQDALFLGIGCVEET